METCRSEIVQEATNYQELYTGLYLNCCDFFYLEDFVGSIGIMLLKVRLLHFPDSFETMPREAKRGNLEVHICAWLFHCGSFRIASTLQQFHVTSTCFSLSFNFIGVLEFFLVTVRPTVLQSQRSCLVLNLWVPPDFRLFSFFEGKNGRDAFLRFRPDIKKIWQEWKLLAIKQPDREQFACTNETLYRNSHYMWQLAVNFN